MQPDLGRAITKGYIHFTPTMAAHIHSLWVSIGSSRKTKNSTKKIKMRKAMGNHLISKIPYLYKQRRVWMPRTYLNTEKYIQHWKFDVRMVIRPKTWHKFNLTIVVYLQCFKMFLPHLKSSISQTVNSYPLCFFTLRIYLNFTRRPWHMLVVVFHADGIFTYIKRLHHITHS